MKPRMILVSSVLKDVITAILQMTAQLARMATSNHMTFKEFDLGAMNRVHLEHTLISHISGATFAKRIAHFVL
jgi:hypothetical protein